MQLENIASCSFKSEEIWAIFDFLLCKLRIVELYGLHQAKFDWSPLARVTIHGFWTKIKKRFIIASY